MTKTTKMVVALAGLLVSQLVSAIPIGYTFQTGGAVGPPAALLPVINVGDTVSGSLTYDNSQPTFPIPSNNGGTQYALTMGDLMGTIAGAGSAAGMSFSDPFGGSAVEDDKAPVGPNFVDLFVVSGDSVLANPPIMGAVFNFSGFTLSGFELVNARLQWLEGFMGEADFLDDESLPSTLPPARTVAGFLVLDFRDLTSGELLPVVFADLSVQRVPEPSALLLLSAALLAGVCFTRRPNSSAFSRIR